MKEKISEFKRYWRIHMSYISLELTDEQIWRYIESTQDIRLAAHYAADYLVAQGLAEVQE